MKMAMESFCSHCMVGKYDEFFYTPAAVKMHELFANDAAEARRLTAFHERLRRRWSNISVKYPVRETDGPFRVGETFNVSSEVSLGKLRPEEVVVELCYGNIKTIDRLSSINIEQMSVKEDFGEGKYLYGCTIKCRMSGRYGFTARVTPNGDDFIKYTPGLITWA